MLRFSIYLIVILGIGCGKENLVKLDTSIYERYKPKEAHVSVELLKSYITNERCKKSADNYYANIFLCKTTIDNDTILVYSICQPTFEFLKNDFRGDRDLIIDSNRIQQDYPRFVFANINPELVNKGYKFVVVDLINLLY